DVVAGSLAENTYTGYKFAGIEGAAQNATQVVAGTVITLTYTRDTSDFTAQGVEHVYNGQYFAPTVTFSADNPQRTDEVVAYYDGLRWLPIDQNEMPAYKDVNVDENGNVVGYPVKLGVVSTLDGKLIWEAPEDVYVTITPRPVTLVAYDKVMNYQGDIPAFDGKYSPGTGLIDRNDLGQISFGMVENIEPSSLEEGVYYDAITATYTPNKNYVVAVQPGTLTVLPSDQNGVNVTDTSVVYDGNGYSVDASALVEGSTIEYSLDGQNWTTENPVFADAGTYTVYVRALADNYSVTDVVTGTVAIAPRPVTITVNNAAKTAGDNDPVFTGSVEGLVNGDDLGEVTYTRTNAAQDAGVYAGAITANYTANANYEVTVINGTFTITDAPAPTPTPTPTTPVDDNPTPVPGPAIPANTPVTPAGPAFPAGAPAAAPAAGPAPAAPAADDGVEIADDENPLAAPDEEILDDENPLAAFDTPQCWVHFLMYLGIVATAVYGFAVVSRRLGYARKINKIDKDMTGTASTSQSASRSQGAAHTA
ncbi:MBG domain-containing protein, partial [Anaerotardibacter muris]|uniref:MBG domain-containing protein n=1 Tax=Anaerotardibacter muris TaxID=2941505 RepID=UPI0023B9B947